MTNWARFLEMPLEIAFRKFCLEKVQCSLLNEAFWFFSAVFSPFFFNERQCLAVKVTEHCIRAFDDACKVKDSLADVVLTVERQCCDPS